jgi:hypothetical protein
LQLLGLVRIELRRGYTPWTFSYTSISQYFVINSFNLRRNSSEFHTLLP